MPAEAPCTCPVRCLAPRRAGPGATVVLWGVSASLAVLAALPARANDASFLGAGATVFAVQEGRVRMVREHVVVRHVGGTGREGRATRWEADVTFRFENLSDAPIEVQMGFPDWLDRSETAVDGPDGPPWVIRDFQAWVGGAPVAAVHKRVAARPPPGPGEDGVVIPPGRVRDLGCDGAWTWTVAFAPRAAVEVRNRYRFGGFDSNGPFAACAGEPVPPAARRAWWRHAARPRGGWDVENGLCGAVTYVVTTGRTWAGPIGEAIVEMDLDPDAPPHLFVPVPEAEEVKEGRVRWHFRDWTPRHEVSVLYARPVPVDGPGGLPAFDTVDQARAWTRFARANGIGRDVVDRLVAWTAAARQRRHDDPAVAVVARAWLPGPEAGEPPPPPLSADVTRRILDVLRRFAATR